VSLAPCEGAAYDLIDMSGSDWGAVESKVPLGARQIPELDAVAPLHRVC